MTLRLAALGLLLCVAGAALGLARQSARRDSLRRRLAAIRPHAATADAQGPGAALNVVAALGLLVARSGILSAKTRAELEQTLLNAGLRGGHGLGLFIGAKLLLAVSLPGLAALLLPAGLLPGTGRIAVIALAGLAGLLAPDMHVRRRRRAHLRQVERGLPDALDMMVICAQAGLGLEASLDRVAEEISFACPAIATELRLTGSELRVGSDRRAALMTLGERTRIESLKRLAATLVQTMQYGTPLSQALRALAAEMRTDTLTRFEERAARLPVLLTMPMVLFILPCVFVVVGGPAGLRVARMLGHH